MDYADDRESLDRRNPQNLTFVATRFFAQSESYLRNAHEYC